MRLTDSQTPANSPAIFNDDLLLDTPAASAYLGSSKPSLERWRRLGSGPNWIKLGGLVKYRKSALDRYIDECTHRPHRRSRLSTVEAG